MAQFLLINRFRAGEGPAEGTSDHDDEMRTWRRVNQALRESGDLVWSLALDAPGDAVACDKDGDGRPRRLTGRAAAPEGVFALHLVDVADAAAAEEWATRLPTADYGTVEVRAVMGPERE